MLRRISIFLLIFAAFWVSLLFSGFGKPMWIDEYLHFAFGGMNFFEAINVLESSTGSGVNWGQTGTYLLMDNLLLSLFGANLLAFRLPSILSGFVLIIAAIYFLRLKGQNLFFQWLVVFAFLAQSSLMYYAGESRPYMPMSSAAVAALAFYAVPISKRSTFVGYFLAFWSFIWGALMHPLLARFSRIDHRLQSLDSATKWQPTIGPTIRISIHWPPVAHSRGSDLPDCGSLHMG